MKTVLAKGLSSFLLPELFWHVALAQTPCVESLCPTFSVVRVLGPTARAPVWRPVRVCPWCRAWPLSAR